eukprot:10243882-Alexandrium_andersonii.AAC.1
MPVVFDSSYACWLRTTRRVLHVVLRMTARHGVAGFIACRAWHIPAPTSAVSCKKRARMRARGRADGWAG